MEDIKVIGRHFQVMRGMIVGMDDKTLKRRKHIVKRVGKGLYEAEMPFHFKRGECFRADASILSKKDINVIVSEAEAESTEAGGFDSKDIKKLRTTKALEDFIAGNMQGYQLPVELDVTNAMRAKAIELWNDLLDPEIDLDVYAFEKCEEIIFDESATTEEKKTAIINHLLMS